MGQNTLNFKFLPGLRHCRSQVFRESDTAETGYQWWPVGPVRSMNDQLFRDALDQASGFQNRGHGMASEAPIFCGFPRTVSVVKITEVRR